MISSINIKTPLNNKPNKTAKNSQHPLLPPQTTKKPPTQQTFGIDTASHADNVGQIPLSICSNKCSDNLVMLRQEFKCLHRPVSFIVDYQV